MQRTNTLTTVWTLTEFGEGERQQRTITIPMRETIVGRTADADICIPSDSVSKRHARFSVDRDVLVVEDLGSTNGTYLNGQRITCSNVAEGDLVQFANAVCRVGRGCPSVAEATLAESILPWTQTLLLFDRLITEREVQPHFQPIVTMDRESTPAYELLARSNLAGLTHPVAMFGVAERLGQQATLSELMREEGIRAAHGSTQRDHEFFLNTHPREVVNERLIKSLRALRNEFPVMRIAIEIHEAALTQPSCMAELRAELTELDMRLSYDDFGAGQGRLLELSEVPPDVLKFDMQLIRGIDNMPASRQDLLAALVNLATDLGTTPLAEGVETLEEHDTCLAMGFQLGQGFLYGRPARLA